MNASRPRRRLSPRLLAFIVLGALLALVTTCVVFAPKPKEEPYKTAAVETGDITRSVSASGTLEALVTVTVGSQLSGQVNRVFVDFNDHVRQGQVLATLDPQTYEQRLAQGRADVAAQNAVVAQQKAQLAEAEANLKVRQAEFNRARSLFDQGFQSRAALDTAQATLDQAQAAVGSSRAAIAAQAARVSQSSASVNANQVDLSRTRIVAPIDGIVIDRQIEPGQTVAASFQAPTLFILARDLSRVQAKILVDEADIGQVREGQPVKFTVDAFPEDTFHGVVTQVRKQPQTEQNVVAYVVLAQADNPDGKLLPGMTANADIVIEELRGAMKVPAAALRFTPAEAREIPNPNRGGGGTVVISGGGGGRGGGAGGARQGGFGGQRLMDQLGLDKDQAARVQPILDAARARVQAAPEIERRKAMRTEMNAALDKIAPILRPDQRVKLEALRARFSGDRKRGTVWILNKEGKPEPVGVRVGVSDGVSTQIFSRSLKPGDLVITGGGPRPKVAGGPPQGRGPG